MKVDKVFVVERYRGAISRTHFECADCHAEVSSKAEFCEGCGKQFRSGYREMTVTR